MEVATCIEPTMCSPAKPTRKAPTMREAPERVIRSVGVDVHAAGCVPLPRRQELHLLHQSGQRVLHSYCNHVSAAQRLERIIAEAEKGNRSPRTAPLPRPAKRLSVDQIGDILTLWHETHNVAAITRTLGWDYGTVRKYLIAAGIDTAWRSLPDQRNDEIIRLHLQGKSTRQIAREVGCSHSKAWSTIRDYKAQAAES